MPMEECVGTRQLNSGRLLRMVAAISEPINDAAMLTEIFSEILCDIDRKVVTHRITIFKNEEKV